MLKKISQLAHEELQGLHPRLLIAQILLAPLPDYVGGRIRTVIYRLVGFKIGHGTTFAGAPIFHGTGNFYGKLTIGRNCFINVGCLFDVNAPITLGDHVGLGHQSFLLTTSHQIGTQIRRAGPNTEAPISIGSGAWIGARAVILPGINIREGAIIAAGALVNKDVPPHTVVGGVPAKPIRQLGD